MAEKSYAGDGYYIDPPNPVSWFVHMSLEIPYIGGALSFKDNPSHIVADDHTSEDPELPLNVTKTSRELAAKPRIIESVCRGLIANTYLRHSGCEFEILALMQKAEESFGKLLRGHFPKDGISGQCPLPTDEKGSCAGWVKQNWPLDDGFSSYKGEAPVVSFARLHATAYFAWVTSYLVRARKWRPQPPIRLAIKTGGGKEREVFDFRVPLDKVVMNSLNIVLQAIIPSQVNSHGYVAKRGVSTAIKQVKELLSQGYCWVQTMDVNKAFRSMKRARVLKTLKSIVGAQVKKVPELTTGLPDKKKRLLQTQELIERAISIDFAKDSKTGEKVFVGDQGLLQGSSLSAVFFNFCMDRLDKKFLPGAEVVIVRYADNIIVLAKSETTAKAAFKRICSYVASYGAKVRREHGIVNLWETPTPVTFLGISLHFDKDGNPTSKLAPSRIRRIAERVFELGSVEKKFQAVNAVFRHYARGGFLTDRAVKDFAYAFMVAAKAGSNGAGTGGESYKSVFSEKALLAFRDSAVSKLSFSKGSGDEEQEEDDVQAVNDVS